MDGCEVPVRESRVELIVFIGIQATGKSAFYLQRFYRTRVRVNLDMLKTRHRENLLVTACLSGQTPFVVDNTNLTRVDRTRYLAPAKAAHFATHGYFFQSRVTDALARNGCREGDERVPDLAIRGARNRLEMPLLAEGFDRLFFVRLDEQDQFVVEDWKSGCENAPIRNGA